MLLNNITIVTAYLEIPKKKFNTNTYISWITNYMNLIKDIPLIIYTNSDNINNLIINLRCNNLKNTKIIKININDLYCYKYIEYWNNDYHRDKEKYHDPLLYLIWNNKTAFIKDAYDRKIFDTNFYMWTDIGMIRDLKTFNVLKNIFLNSEINKINKDKVYLLEVENFNNNKLNYKNDKPYIFNENRCGGGVILCNKNLIEKWFYEYYNMLDKFIKYDIFAGKDQNILNNLYISNRNLIELIKPNNSPIDKWFYMLYYISI